MFRALLFLLGLAIALCTVLYFWSGRRRYLDWAMRLFLGGLGCGVVFFAVLLIKRLI